MLLSSLRSGKIILILGVLFNLTINFPESSALAGIPQNRSMSLPSSSSSNQLLARLPVVPQAIELVKRFEGFRSYSYIDSSGLPVIGYGQTRVNGTTVRMGQFITPALANAALEQELINIQRSVLAHVKVDLNPHQLGALTSLVYNAGVVIVKDSTLIRKLNAGDYAGAAREFPRWNKANLGGALVVYPGLTKRRLAEQQLFSTPYKPIASNN